MDYRTLHLKTVAELRRMAKDADIRVPAGTNKAALVMLILDRQQGGAAQAAESRATEKASAPKQEINGQEIVRQEPESRPAEEQRADRKDPDERVIEKQASERKTARKNTEKKAVEKNTAEKKDTEKKDTGKRAAAKRTPGRTRTAAGTEAIAGAAAEPETGDVQPKPETRPEIKIGARPEKPAAKKVQTEPEVKIEAKPEPKTEVKTEARQEAAAAQAERPAYQRQLSTQQRMGARTHPLQGLLRQQNLRVGRFDAGQRQGGHQSSFQNNGAQSNNSQSNNYMNNGGQAGYRRAADSALQGSYRRGASTDGTANAARRTAVEAEGSQITAAEAPRPTVQSMASLPAQDENLNPAVPGLLQSGDCGYGEGILEIHADGYGFLRAENCLPGNRDVYVSSAQIRRFNLRTGDHVTGKTRAQVAGDRSVGLIYVDTVNGQSPDRARHRRFFDSLVPIYPEERLRMEGNDPAEISLRLIDLVAPIGKGQRGMIVSPPKAGKTTLLKKIANAITANNPDVHLIVLLIDERPEEVTDMKRSIEGEVIYSTFDEAPENHTRVSEMVLERAQRLVELGKDVVILLDSITRLARAYNLVIPPTGRSLSGGLDPGALYKPKRFFGAARNIENGGSLTIIATALVDTGSRMDDIIFEEFKGTGNMELHLDRSLSNRRIFPAIDLYKSGTRREELLLDKEELDASFRLRRMLSKGNSQEAAEEMIAMLQKTVNNRDFCQRLKGWLNACEKDGFVMR